MEIKTIWDKSNLFFDKSVNSALKDGWQLVKREVILCPKNLKDSVFYTELIKLDPPAEPEPMDPENYVAALKVISHTCKTAPSCSKDGCPLYTLCSDEWTGKSPNCWDIPEV